MRGTVPKEWVARLTLGHPADTLGRECGDISGGISGTGSEDAKPWSVFVFAVFIFIP